MSNEVELYRKYRPTMLKQIIGQPEAVQVLGDLIKRGRVPHFMMFTGPSGCGKTTLARIMRDKLECRGQDYCEMNCADFRGVDMVRDIRSRMGLAPLEGAVRMWHLDEGHALTKDAQHAFLKMLEDTPSHVYFQLSTTDAPKLLPTVRNRAQEIKVKPVAAPLLTLLATDVAKAEGYSLDTNVAQRIAEVSEGSPRKALVLLHGVLGLPTVEAQLAAVQSADAKTAAIEIARMLMRAGTRWADIAKVIKDCEEDPESIRYLILAYAQSVLLNGAANGRAYLILCAFEGNFYDSKKAGLTRACYEVCSNSTK